MRKEETGALIKTNDWVQGVVWLLVEPQQLFTAQGAPDAKKWLSNFPKHQVCFKWGLR